MSGMISAGGLISGMDTNTLIRQLMQIERQPITRVETQITRLREQQESLRTMRGTLQTVRNRAQDFKLNLVFGQYSTASSEPSVLTASVSASTAATGNYSVNVTRLASATVASSSAALGAPVGGGATMSTIGVSDGAFSVNGVSFNVTGATTLDGLLTQITSSAAGVNASYDPAADRVTFTNKTAGDTSIINIQTPADGSDFLSRVGLTGAFQGSTGDGATTVTGTRRLGSVDPMEELQGISFASGPVTAGSFSINGAAITVSLTDSLSDVINAINASDAGVRASYDATTDGLQIQSTTLGSRTVSFTSGSSNFLDAVNLTGATQVAGQDAEFSINGGPVQNRNTNEIADAISGVTLNLLSTGTSSVTVGEDSDAVTAKVQEFVDAVNTALAELGDLTASGAVLANDPSLRQIRESIVTTMFGLVSGATGDYRSLVSMGIGTGSDFDSTAPLQFSLDTDAFKEALRTDSASVMSVFQNAGGSGVADRMFTYLDETTAFSGFLNQRAQANGTIDSQIQSYNDRIDRMEERAALKETRLRRQFNVMEQVLSGLQQQNSSLAGIASRLSF
jgi:flagellar hook-associated protein 2